MPGDRDEPKGAADRAGGGPSRIEMVLGEYVERLNEGEALDVEAIRRDHPEIAEDLIAELRLFQSIATEPAAARTLGTLGDYELRRRIGRGGMGVVYEARQRSLDRTVALKVLPAGLAAEGKAFLRFMREAKTAAQLHHPSVVAVFGMGVEGGTPYFAMEYVDGETLAQIVARMRTSPPDARTPFGASRDEQGLYLNVAKAFADVADGLQHAHSNGVIHRDIKPSNLILDSGTSATAGRGNGAGDAGSAASAEAAAPPRLRILDFGLARLEGQESLSATGDVVGTPLYMSPEQARRRKVAIDHRTDIYSLGAALYETLTLEPPFRGRDHEDTLSQIIQRDPRPPRQLNSRVPRDLETIVLKCLRKEPADRFGTAEALAQDLRRVVRGDPIEARPQAAWDRFTRRVWRRKRLLAVGALVLVLLATLALLVQTRLRQAERDAAEALRQREAEYRTLVLDAVWELDLGHMSQDAYYGKEGALGTQVNQLLLGSSEPELDLRSRPVADAVEKLRRALGLFPRRHDAAHHLTRALRRLGDDAEAAKVLEGADPVPPSAWTAPWDLARQSARDQKWKEAAEVYRGMLAGVVHEPEPYLGAELELRLDATRAFAEAGDRDRAIESCSAILALWRGAVGPAIFLGRMYLEQGRKDAAERVFEELHAAVSDGLKDVVAMSIVVAYSESKGPDLALALDWTSRIRDEASRLRLRSIRLHMTDRRLEALEAARLAVYLDPDDAMSHFCLAAVEYGLSHRQEAEASARRALELGLERRPQLGVYFDALHMTGQYARIERELPLVLESDPWNYPNLLGHVLWTQGKREDAERVFSRALDRFPEHELLRQSRAELRLERGLWREADEDLRWIVARRPDRVSTQANRVWVLANLGEEEEALKICREVQEKDPGDWWIHNMLGWSLWRLGRAEDARRELQAARDVDPGNTDSLIEFIGVLARLGRLSEAEAECRRAIEAFSRETSGRSPELASASSQLGSILRDRGDAAGALEALFRGFAADPGQEYHYGQLLHLARRAEGSDAAAARWDELVETLEPAAAGGGASFRVHNALALGRLHGATARDPAKAREHLAHARAAGGSRDPEVLIASAELSALEGRPAEAVRDLGEALRGLEPDALLEGRLAEYRKAAPPDLGPTPGSAAAVRRAAVELREAGRFSEAGERLRAAIASGLEAERDLWHLWLSVELDDLGRAPAEVLATLPAAATTGYGADVAWLLGALGRGESIRIRCGGEECTDSRGRPWGKDRFFLGGSSAPRDDMLPPEIAGTDDDVLYRTVRYVPFPYRLAYAVPLPRGAYRVALHFTETWFVAPGLRRFDVRIEGKEVLRDYEPPVSAADVQRFAAEVEDGVLEIEFTRKLADPKISAIEIERLGS